MSQIISGTYIASDAAVNVECGFVPDRVKLTTAVGGTELVYEWLKVMGDTDALTGQYGILDTAGAKSVPSTAATGITAYDTAVVKQMLPAPNGEGLIGADLPDAFVAGTAQPTARTTTALGTVTKPSQGNETGLVYECTTSTGVYGTEPTWPTLSGDTVTDDQSNVWTARESVIQNQGVQGFTVGASVCTDGEIHAFTAEMHDKSSNMGDADVTNPVLL